MTIRRRLAGYALFVGLWLAGAALFYTHDYKFSYETLYRSVDPMDSVIDGSGLLTAQVVVLYALLRPVSFRNSWGRALLAFVVAAFWTSFLAVGVVHAPGWFHANLLWLVALNAGLVLLAIVSGIRGSASRRGAEAQPDLGPG
jgi:hypothetical protein